MRSKNLTQLSRVQLNSITCTCLVDAGSHDKGSWQIVSSREIPMASEIREAANILDPARIPWCEFLIVALHLWISFCLAGLTEICRSAQSGGDKSVEKKKFVSDISKNSILYFIEGPKYVREATACRRIRKHSQVITYVSNWPHWRCFSQLKRTSAHSQRQSSTVEIKNL